ncbi:uncharacterized protein L3040_006862 [Drepanopeziza brunnea f. sp. 'multigermtubi']|uniref:uncharacterized protein n=1 Tax=Drepanopeziza brunnea f. sp. 'multigermtubi' TaxID=698441 RepID=UPI00239386EA|nr:hypothetical protein L3040_006862 [Drepanopeziza brunnea f. sp. 'multigermtubi']
MASGSTPFMDWVADFKGRTLHPAGASPLEGLPTELLTRILLYVSSAKSGARWTPHALPGDDSPRVVGLLSSLQVSHRLHSVALRLLYHSPSIQASRSLASPVSKFFHAVDQRPAFGALVRTLDLTRAAKIGCDYTLSHPDLSRLPSLRDLRLALSQLEGISTLHHLVSSRASLEALTLDVCRRRDAHSPMLQSGAFDTRPHELLVSDDSSNLTSLRFTDATGTGGGGGGLHLVPSAMLGSLLPRMHRLQVLDVSRTRVTAEALASIPATARLTHLNIAGCQLLACDRLVAFLTTHPAVTRSLQVLRAGHVQQQQQQVITTLSTTSSSSSPSEPQDPLREDQINALLAAAPRSLRSLDLGMARMGRGNIPSLQAACGQLEELSLGPGLTMRDVEDVLLQPMYTFADEHPAVATCASAAAATYSPKEEMRAESILGPMRDAVALCQLRRRLHSVQESRTGFAAACYSAGQRCPCASSTSRHSRGRASKSCRGWPARLGGRPAGRERARGLNECRIKEWVGTGNTIWR